MVTIKPITVGNSLAVVLDKPILEATGSGDVIVLSPVREQGRVDRIKTIADGIFERHAAAFKRLAE